MGDGLDQGLTDVAVPLQHRQRRRQGFVVSHRRGR
jgi:hypothetical protein